MAKKLKLSRAKKWSGSWYFRSESNTWRNKNTSEVRRNLKKSIGKFEPTHFHSYGARGLTKKKAKRLIQFYKPKKRR